MRCPYVNLGLTCSSCQPLLDASFALRVRAAQRGVGPFRVRNASRCATFTADMHDRSIPELISMGILAFLLLGLLAGVIAKALLPGRNGAGSVSYTHLTLPT